MWGGRGGCGGGIRAGKRSAAFRGGQAAAAALADGEDRASADLAAGRPAAEEHQGDGEVRYEIRNSAKVRKVKSAFSF